ncbi:MAG: hypothetical protein GY768_20065 [Planctomycetaceae bacterium]|nr:hypothetical protein [Planctomycetaceae bacterium]
MPPRVLLFGCPNQPEFRDMHDWLQENLQLTTVQDIQPTPIDLNQFDLILIAMSLRFQFSLEAIQQLRDAAPLARICTIVGSWCEGETRSGQAWPAVERIYVHQVVPRAIYENWQEQVPSSPSTFSNDEYWLARANQPSSPLPTDEGILVCSRDHESGQAIALACQQAGFRTSTLPPDSFNSHDKVGIILYDADRNRQQRLKQIRQLANRHPTARLVTLLEFPRHDEISQILAAGGHQVLGKPYNIDDLVACLGQPTDLLSPDG